MITCFDIGGSTIKAAVANPAGEIEPIERVPTPLQDFDAFCAAIAALVDKGGAPAGSAVAISITGVVDPETGIVTCANIPCIDQRRLDAELGARLERPVVVANDADCFVLAEAKAGAGRGHRVVFGAILGTGVGGGMVVDGAIHRGTGGLAGEWGHGPAAAAFAGTPPVSIPEFACGCGQVRCIDSIGAARGMERLHKHLHNRDLPSTAIIAAWEAGEPEAERTIDCMVDLVASPLALVVNIVGPSIIPVGGGLGNVPALIARIDVAVRQRILRRLDRPLVVPAQLTGEPGLLGAAWLALGSAA
ncbi:N-acetylglucosamine kinase [Devosia epidermidihirudinis]|uniref:N-acetylglucosamine kinase n=1 Tax=Devosia epidermidihirudinis TaxID=1293439 RepID=A0A0F5QIW8_9HYPH|nr:ROK family protein [Devosia epidermidihirudinis]KKC40910.1 N-acetylglucosamine kinase [Devosia epidermidihirudinis]